MKSNLAFLVELVHRGGPQSNEYEELDICFGDIWFAKQNGEISNNDLQHAWNWLGRAFSIDTMQGFVVQKPHGYAGDFQVIDRIYQYWLSPDPELVNWDHYFHSRKAPKAVRKRKGYFIEHLHSHFIDSDQQINILNVGSGPGRDLLELFDEFDPSNLKIDCVDMDSRAIRYAERLCMCYTDRIRFIHKNILRYRPNKKYDLIWSAGLFDYLNDKLFIHLVEKFWTELKSLGEIIIGNFSTENPTRPYMEFGDWMLIHRTPEDLINLAKSAGVPGAALSVKSESENVNLFLHVKKP